MVNTGLIGDWAPPTGVLTVIRPTDATRAAALEAPVGATPPSYQQEAYLKVARTGADLGRRIDRLMLFTFRLPGRVDIEIATAAFAAFVRRHDSMHSWFEFGTDKKLIRRVLDAGNIAFEAHTYEDRDTPVLDIIQQVTPDPFHWDCFTFGILDHGESFTVISAMDHLYCDAISSAIMAAEFMHRYFELAGGRLPIEAPVASYRSFCDRERATTAALGAHSPEIVGWSDRIKANGGQLPSFPLPLGTDSGPAYAAMHTEQLLDAAAAADFEAVCRAGGFRLVAGVFAAAAHVDRELAGRTTYFGLTPKSARTTELERISVGWYASLIPLMFSIDEAHEFRDVALAAATAFEDGKKLSGVSLHRVVELLQGTPGFHVREGWFAPMLSFLDVRKLPGAAILSEMDAGVFGSRGSSEEVYLWLNWLDDGVSLAALFPDTPTAHASVRTYLETFRRVLTSVAATGDYRVEEALVVHG
ncbi:condensation domain-containing protein [Nocardia sp. NPDC020380]|uniref:condensation domain-containing protein n=1 Tax=Nocardia sp. NPDC020380 TaxID=3364309 RepID=UPI0037B5E235